MNCAVGLYTAFLLPLLIRLIWNHNVVTLLSESTISDSPLRSQKVKASQDIRHIVSMQSAIIVASGKANIQPGDNPNDINQNQHSKGVKFAMTVVPFHLFLDVL